MSKPSPALSQIRIILVEPQHPGNIGATARAMKNMCMHTLYLVNPKHFPCSEATRRAAGADDVLADAKVVSTVEAAIEDCELVIGASAREREIPWPILNPRQSAEKALLYPRPERVAIVFGTERTGLTNDILNRCDYHLIIPANTDYAALNLSQAVQIITYEMYMAQQSTMSEDKHSLIHPMKKQASNAQKEGVFSHLIDVLDAYGFVVTSKPSRILHKRIKRLLTRAQMDKQDVNILRGIFKTLIREKSDNVS